MVKARSPGYPAIGLREAVEKIKQVYAKDYQNKIPRKIVAEHMGYQSLNGKSLGVLSAIAKYGLLEGRGDENRVSDMALQIIAHPPGSPERAQAIVQAAQRPELFAELDGKFQGGKASDASLRSFLITQKFIPQAADATIRAYRETKALVNEEAANYSAEGTTQNESEASAMTPAMAESGLPRRPSVATQPPAMQPGEKELFRGSHSRDSTFRLLVSGAMTAKGLGKIIRILALQQELLSETEAEENESTEEQ